MRRFSLAKKQRRLVHFALRHLGKPYRYGAAPSEAPRIFDCSSFVQYLYRRVGIELPRTSIGQAKCGRTVRQPWPRNLSVGDLLFFTGSEGRYNSDFPQGIGHVAMYAGEGTIVHAKWKKKGKGRVVQEPVAPWLQRPDLVTAKRLL